MFIGWSLMDGNGVRDVLQAALRPRSVTEGGKAGTKFRSPACDGMLRCTWRAIGQESS